MERTIREYDDIIRLAPPELKHPKMPPEKRAAQFAPFAALKGYEDIVSETARLTEEKLCLADDEIERISAILSLVENTAKSVGKYPLVGIRYFVSDERKHGGKYRVLTARPKSIDAERGVITFEGGRRLFFSDIADIFTEVSDAGRPTFCISE